jgi:hypothetical protein
MSAFILSDKHFYTIAALLMKPQHVQETADALKRINIKSVNYRYKKHPKTRVTKCIFSIEDVPVIKMDDLYMLAHCWIYQSCENENDLEFKIMHNWIKCQLNHLGLDEKCIERSTMWTI